ncbi:hypothetical protein [Demequina lutea]|uniref:Uncharacterized protein n=1 Tax=Demequina lutea TaxID=431489 RepID=A0A7Z0CH14_9MICO|nr:hypothetical protein [Demequina lutea]NYI40334.1 hypothetical protein [Demequina lutea]
MTNSVRLVLFAVGLLVALGLGLAIGAAAGPITAAGADGGTVVHVGEVS